MSIMTNQGSDVFVGIDTHRDVHHVAIIDGAGREVADHRFDATVAGYQELIGWVHRHGRVSVAAVEGTGSYGAAVTRVLTGAGWVVRETVPGDRVDRRLRGKTDAADAFTAARAALSGRASATPKDTTGVRENIRVLREARRLLVRQQTQLMNQIKAFLITGPAELREQHDHLTGLQLARRLAAIPVTGDTGAAATAASALSSVLRSHATHWLTLRDTAATMRKQLTVLLTENAPQLMNVSGVGPDSAAALLVAAGQHDRIRSESALAHLFGIAPIHASSGQTTRHRLDRGGNRQGNAAIHRIALVRMSHEPRTREFIAQRLARGKTKREAIRILKRHIIREIYPHLTTT